MRKRSDDRQTHGSGYAEPLGAGVARKKSVVLMVGHCADSLGFVKESPTRRELAMATGAAPQTRLASLDQFRGYTVAGMFLVNYLGGFIVCPYILKHHNTYCSYADTIMPQFFFAVGFSLRLSFGRRVMQQGLGTAYWHMAKRLIGLALVAIFITYQGSPDLKGAPFTWDTMKNLGVWGAVHDSLKREWFQTLMHIAVTSLWILPVIRMNAIWRILYMIGSALIHLGISHVFYFNWVNASPAGIDGGPFGFLTWTIPTMIGTLACDAALRPGSRGGTLARIFAGSVVVLALGWIASCATRLYDMTPAEVFGLKQDQNAQDAERNKLGDQKHQLGKKIDAETAAVDRINAQIAEIMRVRLRALVEKLLGTPISRQFPPPRLIDEAEKQLQSEQAPENVPKLTAELQAHKVEIAKLRSEVAELDDKLRAFGDLKLARNPVIPPQQDWKGRTWKDLVAEPPFVPPPADDPRIDVPPYELHRYWNYWMMSQRCGTISYLTFGAGISLAVYGLFFLLSDMIGVKIGVFRTLGTNALFGYVLHDITGDAVKKFVPKDVPPTVMWISFAVFFYITWLFMRSLEKQKIYIKL